MPGLRSILKKLFKGSADDGGWLSQDSVFAPLFEFFMNLFAAVADLPWWMQLVLFAFLLLLALLVLGLIYEFAQMEKRNQRRLKTLRKRRDMRRTQRENRKRSLEYGYRDHHGLLRIRKSFR